MADMGGPLVDKGGPMTDIGALRPISEALLSQAAPRPIQETTDRHRRPSVRQRRPSDQYRMPIGRHKRP